MQKAGNLAIKSDPFKTGLEAVKRSMAHHLQCTLGKNEYSATKRDWYHVVAYTVRDYLIERWLETHKSYNKNKSKRVYYLSMEFLIGKTLENSLINVGIEEAVAVALKEWGVELNDLVSIEDEAGLGNGGLGRLAACFLDSMATIGIPGYGYGIRYEYGMFFQQIKDFEQVEHPDNWLRYGNPWEFPRPEYLYQVKFNGRVHEFVDVKGVLRHEWVDTEEVMAMAYDIPIPGFGTRTVNNLRLWGAKSGRDFDLDYFNTGNYIKAVENKNTAENLSKILYPNDSSDHGKVLRLKQEYFLVSATLQDILRRYKKDHDSLEDLSSHVSMQLNDTHPAMAVAELMRLLVDGEGIPWERAWEITSNTINYTNHTVMPEALEKWPLSLMEKLLPRHTQIIYEINRRFLDDVYHNNPGDIDLLRRVSIIEEGDEKRVRMAHLAIVGSSKVNGVAAIHSQILKDRLFNDFFRVAPGKFTNKTNGISQRVWLQKANRALSAHITGTIGEGWTTDLFELKKMSARADDASFQDRWMKIKRQNKAALAALIQKTHGVAVSPDSIFDVQIKRIHEYKRQLLNVLHIITLYNRVRSNPNGEFTPRTFIFSGKAAPGYRIAKDIVALINSVADIVNNDPLTRGLVKVAFLPNYNVTLAEKIVPAADLSEQISTAGTEASGTGCMKLALNGALTICTLDGANIEMMEEFGEENIFVFGLKAAEVDDLRGRGYNPHDYYHSNHELKEAIDMIARGYFSPRRPDAFRGIVNRLLAEGDSYMVLADYADYVRCQDRISLAYRDRKDWARKSILNVANCGKFSSDRTIAEYADEIWKIGQGSRT